MNLRCPHGHLLGVFCGDCLAEPLLHEACRAHPEAVADLLRPPWTDMDAAALAWIAERGSSRCPPAVIVPALATLVNHPDPGARKGAVYGLVHHLIHEEALAAMVALGLDRDPDVARAARASLRDDPGRPAEERGPPGDPDAP